LMLEGPTSFVPGLFPFRSPNPPDCPPLYEPAFTAVDRVMLFQLFPFSPVTRNLFSPPQTLHVLRLLLLHSTSPPFSRNTFHKSCVIGVFCEVVALSARTTFFPGRLHFHRTLILTLFFFQDSLPLIPCLTSLFT